MECVSREELGGYSCTGCRELILVKDCCALQCSHLVSNVAAFLDSVSYAYA